MPRFQRKGTEITWTPEQRGDLLDSLYRGFPVGTILLWSTNTEVPSNDRVAGFKLPDRGQRKGPMRMLLDGHQRLSTLLAILGPGLTRELGGSHCGIEHEEVLAETWVFETRPAEIGVERVGGQASTRECFVLLKRGQKASRTQIPPGALAT